MNKTFLVMLLVVTSIVLILAISGRGDVLINVKTSPAGFSASGKIDRSASQNSSPQESPSAAPVVSSKTAGNSQSPAKPLEERYQSLSQNSRLPTLDSRLAELRELYPYREFAAEEVLDLMSRPNAWQPASTPPDSLPLTEAQRNDGREFIDMNPARLEVLLPGDSFELPLERLGMHLKMEVESREALPGGGFTLHGRVLGGSELMRVTITQSPGLSIAGIDTPQGHVVMQANDDQGWIASSETLFKQDPHRTDMVLPQE